MPGRPTSLDDSRASAYCVCSSRGLGAVWTFGPIAFAVVAGWELIGHFFFSSIFSVFFLPLFGRRPDIV